MRSALIVVLGALLTACGRPGAAIPAPHVDVGTTDTATTFLVSAPGLPAGVPITVTLFTPAGTRRVQGRSGPGSAQLTVSYARAGLTPYRVQVGPRAVTGELRRVPGPPVTPLQLKIGARAVRVTWPRPPALVLHPLDAQGNVAALLVTVRSTRPDGTVVTAHMTPRHLYAWTWLPTGHVPGLMHVVATTGHAAGEVGDVDVLPGPPARAQWTAARRVDALADRAGNRVGDGEALSVQGTRDGWNVTLPVTPVNARAALRADVPGGTLTAEGWATTRTPANSR
ncbi:hypothetical protein HNQ07_002401 [Deinococcus metalli]|uniref:Uncharacterized protein n=1 Tax=Deinococcus metalli TaxID=1141878 RepID=A0A7W8KEY0_9DEIO|nr:hypothetical protein [Deinococcus metalli]MBB5376937.1 hypothetical protein [Deinococcus metalli]GHF46436.1 hypothetical protein GCM10017781_23640 [Deinococcus metalli]